MKKKKILIIEDEKMLREMYRDKLCRENFEVVSVDSAEEGIKIIPKEKPNLILLDILLPKANGLDFMEWFRKEKKFSAIPIIAFSNYDEPAAKKEALKLGVKDYLIKTNYTPKEIVIKIKKYLKK